MTDDEMIALTMLIADEVEYVVKGKTTSGQHALRARLKSIKARIQSATDKASPDDPPATEFKVDWM